MQLAETGVGYKKNPLSALVSGLLFKNVNPEKLGTKYPWRWSIKLYGHHALKEFSKTFDEKQTKLRVRSIIVMFIIEVPNCE